VTWIVNYLMFFQVVGLTIKESLFNKIGKDLLIYLQM